MVLLILVLAAPLVRAQSDATLVPPHSDAGVDFNSNLLWDVLRVDVNVDVTVAGGFVIAVDLYDGTFSTYITTGVAFPTLPFGANTVSVDVPGSDIYLSAIDGPYIADIYVYDDIGNQDDNGVHTTGMYQAVDFDPPPVPDAVFAPPHSDTGVDTDANTLFNFLQINATVDVNNAGTFDVNADAYDSSFNYITSAFGTATLAPGPGQVIIVNLPGGPFRANGVDGPYSVDLTLFGPSGFLDFNTHTTAPYSFMQFELPTAAFAPPHSDTGVDTDADTLFNFLRINASVDVNTAGTYDVDAAAYDSTFNFITSATVTVSLSIGAGQIVPVDLTGWLFRSNGVDGPYTVDLSLYETFGPLLDTDTHMTAPYASTQFEMPPASFAPPHTDMGVDTDGDSLFNAIEVGVSLSVDAPGDYIMFIDFWDATHVTYITGNLSFPTLAAGPQTEPMWVSTLPMLLAGIDGPYAVDLTLFDSSFNLLDQGNHTTGTYTVSQFDPLPAQFAPPHSDAGEDRDTPPDGLYNVLRVDVSLNVSDAGTYAIFGTLQDFAMTTVIDSQIRIVGLTPGAQTVPVWFSGTLIQQSGIDGPYNVTLDLLAFPVGLPIDNDVYTTGLYAAADFQTLVPATLNGTIRDVTTSLPVPFANVNALDYLNGAMMTTSADGAGFYSLGVYEGDWTVLFDDFAHDTGLSPVTVTGPTTLDFDLIPTTPDLVTIDSTLGPWTSLDVVFTGYIETDVISLRTQVDWLFGDRDKAVSQSEWDVFLSVIGFTPPAPPNSTWDSFLVDSMFYDLVPGSDSFGFFDAPGPIGSTVPIRIEQSFSFDNPSIGAAASHTLLANVTWDDPAQNFTYSVALPSGYVLSSYVADPGVTVTGVGTGTALVDPGPDPNPFDSIISVWIQLDVVSGDATDPVVSSAVSSPDPVDTGNPVTFTAAASDDTGLTEVRLEVWSPLGGAPYINVTMADIGGGNYDYVSGALTILGDWTFTVTATDLAGNTGSRSGTFSVIERNPPTISSTSATPDPQEFGGSTLLSATVSDDTTPTASLTVNVDLGALGNVSMVYNASSGDYEYAAMFPVGTHPFTVWAWDEFGNAASASGSFVVQDTTAPAVSGLGAAPDPVEAGNPTVISVTATDLAGISSITVTIVDPNSVTVGTFAMTPIGGGVYQRSFTPSLPGVYTFSVTATDPSTNSATTPTSSFTSTDTTLPIANAGVDQTASIGATVTFNGTGSTDNGVIVNYTWTFTVGPTPYTLYGAMPTHVFTAAGTITVTLTVRDGAGNSDTDTMTVTVQDLTAPTANAGPDQSVPMGTTVTFNGAGSSDNVGVTNYTWSFTEGASTVVLYGSAPTHRFDTPGIYIVTLTVKDAVGLTGTDTVRITVTDTTNPTADAGTDQTVGVGATVTFNGTGSSDNVGVTNYTWTFTVGSTTYTLYGSAPTFVFTATGTITVTLTVRDAAANSDTDTMTVTVRDQTNPVANAGPDQTVTVGATVTFDGTASSDNAGVTNYTWTFTAGTTTVTLYGSAPTHVFTTTGTIDVTLTVRDAAGNTDTDTVTIVVQPAGGGVGGIPSWVYVIVALVIIAIIAMALLFLRRKKTGGGAPPSE